MRTTLYVTALEVIQLVQDGDEQGGRVWLKRHPRARAGDPTAPAIERFPDEPSAQARLNALGAARHKRPSERP